MQKNKQILQKTKHKNNNNNNNNRLPAFVPGLPGRPVPTETLSHSHPSWSSDSL